MRKIIAQILLSAMLLMLSCHFTHAQVNNKTVVIKNVSVIDVSNGKTRTRSTVVIKENKIISVGFGKTGLLKGATIIEGTGKFLIPGLWNMHVHLGDQDFDRNFHLKLYVINGVTGVRFMDGDQAYHVWRNDAETGKLLAPRMVIASPQIGFGSLSNISETQAREEVRKAKETGANLIKVHDNVPRASYFPLVDEARKVNLSVEGHVPSSITAIEASQAGQKSIEHFTGLDEAASDEKKADELTAVLRKNHTWLCPTIVMRSNYASLDNANLANDERLQYVKPAWKQRWLNMTKDAAKTPAEEWAKRRELVRKEKALVGKMQRAGIGVLAGTDDANPYVMPGFSLHDELALLVEAGLTPLQALRTATINPARFFGKEKDLGTIEKGKLADLILLDANPLEKIENTRQINAVIINGKYIDDQTRQKILSEIEEATKKN